MASVNSSLSALSARFQLISVLSLWFLFLAPVDAVIVNRSEEIRTLLRFADDNFFGNPPQGLSSTWKETDATPCDWFGVTCTANYTVEELDFSGWGFQFFSLYALYNLPDLRHLDLSSNAVSIPDDIGNFTRLTRLDLSQNIFENFTLPPSISACRNLHFLSLEQSDIDTLPPGMSELTNLQFLSLAGNNFTSAFPTEQLGNLSSLVILDLSGNSFTGAIPSLPKLTNLVQLKLDNNNFTGFEEPWFVGAKSLQQLSVSNNQLGGKIPSSITGLLNLTNLNMSRNNLSGQIPSGFSVLLNSSMELDLSNNQLSGEIPDDMLQVQQSSTQECSSISLVNVSHNLLTGKIPIDGSKLLCLWALDLSYNNLSGPIPSNFFMAPNTTIVLVLLNNNTLSGDIVEVLGGPGLLRTSELRLGNNLFTGDLSRMANISFLTPIFSPGVVDLSNNHLQWSTSESIPDPVQATLEVLTSLSFLSEFRVGGNNFSGTPLPTACFVNSTNQFSSLNILDLSNSHLQGEILDVAFNSTCLPNIQFLNLSNNHATGPLSKGIITHQQDFILDVSNNDLSGSLPVIPTSSSLYNPKYFAGNAQLCGGPLLPCSQKQGRGMQRWLLLITIGGSMTIALGSCLAATWQWRVYHKRHQQDADLIKILMEREVATLMPLWELKKATSNFAKSAQIGEGGFGTVYVGKLNDGTMVAIKRTKREGSEMDKAQFLNEVRILSQVNHRHLVKLLGCCMENRTAVLVFEFVSNGTLQEHLQGKIGADHLSWKQRLNIAIQTADALNYLHSAATSPVFHRDVKSANILLNEDLDAKVADFGISKLAPLQATHVSTIVVQGTMGYIDPEYYTSYQLTDRSDVYGFGVVLLELISAKPALDFHRGGDESSLVNLARPYIEGGDLAQFIDPVLIETYHDTIGQGRESILQVGRLAIKCLEMYSRARPSMGEVLKELQNIWVEFVGTSKHLDSIIEDGNKDDDEDFLGDGIIIPSKAICHNSSSLMIQNHDGSSSEMSCFSPLPTFRSHFMG